MGNIHGGLKHIDLKLVGFYEWETGSAYNSIYIYQYIVNPFLWHAAYPEPSANSYDYDVCNKAAINVVIIRLLFC